MKKQDEGIDKFSKDFINQVMQLSSMTTGLYIYGAGLYARNLYSILNSYHVSISGFIVTVRKDENMLFGHPVLSASDVLDQNVGIIIGVNGRNRVEVMKYLALHNFDMKRVVQGTDFFEKDADRYDDVPVMEITTRVGCSVNCKYCPQDSFIKNYYALNSNREKVMSLQTFERCLDKLPENARVVFSGMSEPFLNSQCAKMIQKACESGRKVDIYTTLVGANKDTLEEIKDISIEYVMLHLADKYGYAHIPVNEDYYEMIDYIVNMKKKDGRPFVSACNAQAEPDEHVAEICKGKYEIFTTMLDRAGNLKDKSLFSKQYVEGSIECSFCGDKLNRNVMLPDGTVLLCCMDYGMKHVLGNLMFDSYESIINGDMHRKIKEGMKKDSAIDILCRRCTSAHPMCLE